MTLASQCGWLRFSTALPSGHRLDDMLRASALHNCFQPVHAGSLQAHHSTVIPSRWLHLSNSRMWEATCLLTPSTALSLLHPGHPCVCVFSSAPCRWEAYRYTRSGTSFLPSLLSLASCQYSRAGVWFYVTVSFIVIVSSTGLVPSAIIYTNLQLHEQSTKPYSAISSICRWST
jgi:hypothetical protein